MWALTISEIAKGRVVKFCMRVIGNVKSQHKVNDDKSPLKGAWSGSSDPL